MDRALGSVPLRCEPRIENKIQTEIKDTFDYLSQKKTNNYLYFENKNIHLKENKNSGSLEFQIHLINYKFL